MTDNVFPEDSGTGGYAAGNGDFDEAANFASLADAVGLTDYIVEGLSLTLNAGTPSLDVSQGKAVVTQASTTGGKSGDTRDNGVAFVAELDARTGLSLTDSDVNHVFLSVDLSSADTINIIVNTTDSAPSQPYVKLGTVDTSNDTTTELNRLTPIALADLQSKAHSELTGIGASDHHAKYTDEEAQDAVGTILSGDFSYDDAGNSIDLASNQVTVAGNTVSLGSSTPIDHSDLSNIGAGDHHTRFSEAPGDNVTDIPNRDVEDLTSQGVSGSVPVSQGDGTLQMQEVGGGLERISDLDGLVAYKQSFNTIRNRADWIDHIFQNNESMADEITNSQVLTHYVFESEDDAYDRFIDPNHSLGLFAYNNDSEPTISSVYEGAMFLSPTSFLEGLMTIESVADQITNSETLMDAVHNGDAIMENNFGYEAGA